MAGVIEAESPADAREIRLGLETRPWKGLSSYEDTEADEALFFGRSAETRDLLALVEHDTLSVLTGVSGIGKTSLLQAGLFPSLRQRKMLPVYVRLAHQNDAPALEQQVLTQLTVAANSRSPKVEAPAVIAGDDLWQHLHRKSHRFWDERQWAVTPVIVLDQFEEIFTVGRENDRAERSRRFLQSLSRLVLNKPPDPIRLQLESAKDGEPAAVELAQTYLFEPVRVRVLLSLRQDHLAELEELRSLLPNISTSRLQLSAFTRVQAREIVEEPAQRARPDGSLLGTGATDAIVSVAAAQRGDDRPIEPAFLSLFCQELYDRTKPDPITSQAVQNQQAEILRAFYDGAFEAVPEPERVQVRQFVEEQLLTKSGRRDSRDVADVVGAGLFSAGALDALVRARLLRYEQRAGGERRVELSHDVLLKVAVESRAERQARRGKKAATPRERRPPRRLLLTRAVVGAALTRTAVGAALLGLLGLLAGVVAAVAASRHARDARESRDRIALTAAQADFELAQMHLQDDQASTALAYLARSLRARPDYWPSAALLRNLLVNHRWNIQTSALRHGAPVVAVAFSPDGRRAVTAAMDNTARVWDAASGQPLSAPLQHQGGVIAVAFSPDGSRVVTASLDNTARIWNAASGQPLSAPFRHQGAVFAAAFSPDGHRILTASQDGTARIWDADSGAALFAPLRHQDWVVAAAFSPDGRRVATASSDGTARIWDATSGQPLSAPLRHEYKVVAVTFSPDGRRVATASSDNSARIWDATSGQPLSVPLRHRGFVFAAAFSPDGHRLVTASADGTARIWDADSGEPLFDPLRHQESVNAASFSPDGGRIVTVSFDGTARIWDAGSGLPLSDPLRHQGWVVAGAFSPDGRRLLTASYDGAARIWDLSPGDSLSEPLRHQNSVVTAAFSPDGRRVVTASEDGTARVWEAASGKPLTDSLRHDGSLLDAAFSPDGHFVVTTSIDATARIWDAESGKLLCEPLRHQGPVYSARFSPDGRRVLTASDDKTARLWDARSCKPVSEPLRHEGAVSSATFSPDGRRILTASRDKTARLWDADSGRALFEARHRAEVASATFSPDGRRILTACDDHTARIWDADSGKPLSDSLFHQDRILAVAFSPDGRRVVTASVDKTARIWDALSGKPLSVPLRHQDYVSSVAFSPDGRRIVTGSFDDTARIWDAASGKPVSAPLQHQGSVRSAAFSPDGQRVVTASDDGTARIWNVQDPALPCPAWFTAWTEGFAGFALDENGLETPHALKTNEIPATEPGDLYHQLAAWALSRGPQKPLWPGSRRTVDEWIDARIAEGTRDAIDEAYDALPGDPLVLAASANLKAGKSDLAIFEAHYAASHSTVYAETADGQLDTGRSGRVCDSARAALTRVGLKADVVASLTARCTTRR